MKWRIGVFVVWILLLACLGVFRPVPREDVPGSILAARVDRDCAPWDGPAFTITIPESAGDVMISIWQEPGLHTASRFRFPDPTGRWGSALLHTGDDRWVELRGNVALRSVTPGEPMWGRLDLTDADGWRLRGEFQAEWETLAVYCA